jgi:tRNA A-37 threonylcarbamoyl transferase component Bud32
LLAELGLESSESFLGMEGAIVSGHPDRHVMRIKVGGIPCFLKREHRVPARDRVSNFFAGYDTCSVSVREAQTLDILARKQVPVPEWMAAGETSDGRAFLLIRAIEGARDLRAILAEPNGQRRQYRRQIARKLAREIARIHNGGNSYPDLCAKHVLLDPKRNEFSFLDWQRSRRGPLNWHDRCRDLAGLNASLTEELADPDVRLAFLLSYWQSTSDHSISFREVCARIQTRSVRLLERSSIREQRMPKIRDSQPLFWLDGEALCVTSAGREFILPDRMLPMAYSLRVRRSESLCRQIELGDGRTASLSVRRTVRKVGPVADWLKGRRWLAPECREAAQLLREERLGQPERLLAFGQRRVKWGVVDSFILTWADSAKEGRPQ